MEKLTGKDKELIRNSWESLGKNKVPHGIVMFTRYWDPKLSCIVFTRQAVLMIVGMLEKDQLYHKRYLVFLCSCMYVHRCIQLFKFMLKPFLCVCMHACIRVHMCVHVRMSLISIITFVLCTCKWRQAWSFTVWDPQLSLNQNTIVKAFTTILCLAVKYAFSCLLGIRLVQLQESVQGIWKSELIKTDMLFLILSQCCVNDPPTHKQSERQGTKTAGTSFSCYTETRGFSCCLATARSFCLCKKCSERKSKQFVFQACFDTYVILLYDLSYHNLCYFICISPNEKIICHFSITRIYKARCNAFKIDLVIKNAWRLIFGDVCINILYMLQKLLYKCNSMSFKLTALFCVWSRLFELEPGLLNLFHYKTNSNSTQDCVSSPEFLDHITNVGTILLGLKKFYEMTGYQFLNVIILYVLNHNRKTFP